MKELREAICERRSYYLLQNKSNISDQEIKKLVDLAVTYVPSAFNSRSTRTVILLGKHHHKLWEIVKDVLREKVGGDAFLITKSKIEKSFQAGYGTVLFYEDQTVIQDFQKQFPLYSDNFPVWSEQSSGMHQYVVWTLLQEAGFGVSLQHYNPLIDNYVAKTWNIKPEWKLIAQMPFGVPAGEPGEKEYGSLTERSILFE